jgi:hypothetical protein
MSPKELLARDPKGGDGSRRNRLLGSLGITGDPEIASMTFRGARLVWNSPGAADFQPVFYWGESNQDFAE